MRIGLFRSVLFSSLGKSLAHCGLCAGAAVNRLVQNDRNFPAGTGILSVDGVYSKEGLRHTPSHHDFTCTDDCEQVVAGSSKMFAKFLGSSVYLPFPYE